MHFNLLPSTHLRALLLILAARIASSTKKVYLYP